MNYLNFRTLLVAALTLTAAQASFAIMCTCPFEPPSGKNGWQPAATAKSLPVSATAKPRLHPASGH